MRMISRMAADLSDRADFDNAARGFIVRIEPGVATPRTAGSCSTRTPTSGPRPVSREGCAARYVPTIGGIDATLAKAREYVAEGDLRFAVELASHAVFAEPATAEARDLLADVLTRLGHGSENATWRNCFLSGAFEIHGTPTPAGVSSAGMASALTITQLFDSIAIRIDGRRAWGQSVSINWTFTDTDETYRMELSNGVLIHHPTQRAQPADLDVSLTKGELLGLLGGAGIDGLELKGDSSAIETIIGFTDATDPAFAILTP